MKAFVLCLRLFAALSARAENEPPLLSAKEIAKSTLSPEEKHLATLSLKAESMINCFSAREQLAGDFERLRIYHFPHGENLAVFTSFHGIRVFVNNESTPNDLANSFKRNATSTFSHVNEDEADLTLEFGRMMPGVGKTATAVMQDPSYESSLVCFLKQLSNP